MENILWIIFSKNILSKVEEVDNKVENSGETKGQIIK